jgi:hypothetical protein
MKHLWEGIFARLCWWSPRSDDLTLENIAEIGFLQKCTPSNNKALPADQVDHQIEDRLHIILTNCVLISYVVDLCMNPSLEK